MGCPSECQIGNNLVFSICTHDPDTGELSDAQSAPSYRIYEDETATAILTGSMAKLDDANTTGFYTGQIACSTANGFENGKNYTVYITATVDSDTGGIAYTFKAVGLTGGLTESAAIDLLIAKLIGNSVLSSNGTVTYNKYDNSGTALAMRKSGNTTTRTQG